VNTDFTITGYASLTSSEEFVAVHCGALRTKAAVLVRIHSQCLTGDAFGSTRCDCGAQLRGALDLLLQDHQAIGFADLV
jgi:GTP cyclohydrolase II